MATIWEGLHEAVTLLFMTKPGDFLILHLITSLHAMEQIANRLSIDKQKRAIKCYWTAILGIARWKERSGSTLSPEPLSKRRSIIRS
jgi:hypothetical protein